MSDSFADLWNTTAPPKPTLQKLASSYPQLNNAARRPQNDVFSMLSSAASTPNNSRPITPNARPIAQQKPAQASSAGGDAFSSLLGGTLGSNGNGMANMTIAERARRVELERQRKANAPPPASTAGSAWDGLDSLAAGPSSSTATPASAALLDDDWGFGSAPIASTSPAPPKAQPVVVLDEEDDWGLGLGSASHTATPPPPSTAPPTKGPALWDHLDDFTSAKPSPPARFASPTADFDFGDRENNAEGDDFDLLGDLGKPVSAISSRRPSPQQTPSPAEPPARRKPTQQQRSASPPPHILGQLIEMGFSIPQSRAALAQVHRDGTWDVQAALDSLLASTGGAEGSSRTATPPSVAAPPPRRRPSERERGSPQPAAAAAVPSVLQSDLLARTSEIGFSLFKNAERAWLQGKEKVQKAYEERMMGAEEVKVDRTGGSASGRAEQRARPKWMQQDREGPEDAGGPSVGRRRDDSRQLFQDDARGKDDGWGDAPAGGWKDDEEEEEAPKPATQPADLFSIDAGPAKPYVSPFRHGKGRAPAAAAPTVRAAPAPQPTAPPPRPHIPVSPAALQTSRTHAAAAEEKIALGQYGAALAAATRAVDALPAGHVLRVPLLCLRALALLKEGDFRGVEADAGEVEGICGQGQGGVGREAVVVEGTGVDLGAAVVEVWKRRGEALEGRERWEEAGRDWERVAGAGWAKQADRDEGVRGAGRCRRMAAPVPAAPKPKPKPKAPPHTVASGEALANLRQATNAQEEEDAARYQLKDAVDGKLLAWKGGKETNVRALLASLETVLWPELGLAASGMKDLVTPGQVKVRYVKAIAKLHPDKLNANNSTLEQRMIANGVFGALNEAWNAFK
ncbi:hypothetical protein B0H11DRAFT_2320093 [Mycena galericulata]|nr:hypothetical protein B0H11DRAFT_2320093 [Mycena galericulata]